MYPCISRINRQIDPRHLARPMPWRLSMVCASVFSLTASAILAGIGSPRNHEGKREKAASQPNSCWLVVSETAARLSPQTADRSVGACTLDTQPMTLIWCLGPSPSCVVNRLPNAGRLLLHADAMGQPLCSMAVAIEGRGSLSHIPRLTYQDSGHRIDVS